MQGQDHRSLYHKYVKASKVNWISGSPPDSSADITAKIRYRSLDSSCRINYDSQNVFIEFETPKFAVAPGQSIVFYDHDICIGGGFIESRANKNIA